MKQAAIVFSYFKKIGGEYQRFEHVRIVDESAAEIKLRTLEALDLLLFHFEDVINDSRFNWQDYKTPQLEVMDKEVWDDWIMKRPAEDPKQNAMERWTLSAHYKNLV